MVKDSLTLSVQQLATKDKNWTLPSISNNDFTTSTTAFGKGFYIGLCVFWPIAQSGL